MKYISIHNLTRPGQKVVLSRYCDTPICRLRGLMFRRTIPPEQGLLLVQSRDSRLDSSIHMMFVWIDLAVFWVNDVEEVVDTCLARSWRPIYIPKKPARYVLEMAAENEGIFQIGDKLRFEEAWLD